MKISDVNKIRIQSRFTQMESTKDFLELLNFVNHLISGSNSDDFSCDDLRYYSNPKRSYQFYKSFEIKKKSKGSRTIHAPKKKLKTIQRCINIILQSVFESHQNAYGFVSGKSIVDNARIHQNKEFVYNIDLKDFFSNIDQARVKACLKLRPFNLEDANNSQIISNLISGLCSIEVIDNRKNKALSGKRYVLAQGAPTSPILSNIVCQRLDYLLTGLAKRFNLKYSRYADDITFSSDHHVYHESGDFVTELKRLIENQNFNINTKKVRLQRKAFRQEVTGLVVNEKPNVHRKFLKEIRMWLYYWERYGIKGASSKFNNSKSGSLLIDTLDSGEVVLSTSYSAEDFKYLIDGKLNYLKMVKGSDNSTYISLKQRYNRLISKESFITKVLDKWEDEGIDKAIELYEKRSFYRSYQER